MALASSSYIDTDGATVQRPIEALSFPFTGRPQDLTIYLRFVDAGAAAHAVATGNAIVVFQMGDTLFTAPRLYLAFGSSGGNGVGNMNHDNGIAARSVTATGQAIQTGDLVEFRGILNSDGSIQVGVSANGGAEVLSGASSANALASAWHSQNIVLTYNSTVSGVGSVAYLNVKVVRGIQTLDRMRVLAGVK